MMNIQSLYQQHLETTLTQLSQALEVLNYSSLVLGSGIPFIYFQCDASAPFRTNPAFAHICPAKGPHHLIRLTQGQKPILIFYNPDDYWHNHEPLPEEAYWFSCFDVKEASTLEQRWNILRDLGDIPGQSVFLGNETLVPQALGYKVNCELLQARLQWIRRYKTPYEQQCLWQANLLAVPAHNAAYRMFMQGGSEFEIHNAYLNALGVVDADLPYDGIVALDAHGAILHHTQKNHQKNGRVLLLDSGAKYENYGSDITRTHTTTNCDALFAELTSQMDNLQKTVCSWVAPGVSYPDIHQKYHIELAKILQNLDILHGIDPEQATHEGLIKNFFPHGLGHALGVQVHDIPKHQLDPQGNPIPFDKFSSPVWKSLRFLGTLETNMVVTIEPGVYFIPMLLSKLRTHPKHSGLVNWQQVNRLVPFGGIRIEDNVVVTADGHRNLTREAFAARPV